MRLSEFQRAMREEFGETYSSVLIRDHWVAGLESTAGEALDRGVAARDVWAALCVDLDVPVDRRHGRGLRDPNRSV